MQLLHAEYLSVDSDKVSIPNRRDFASRCV